MAYHNQNAQSLEQSPRAGISSHQMLLEAGTLKKNTRQTMLVFWVPEGGCPVQTPPTCADSLSVHETPPSSLPSPAVVPKHWDSILLRSGWVCCHH